MDSMRPPERDERQDDQFRFDSGAEPERPGPESSGGMYVRPPVYRPERPRSFFRRHPVLTIFGIIVVLSLIGKGIQYGGGMLPKGDGFGVIKVEGFMDASGDVVDWAEVLREDDSIKGVLVYVNSPGGAVVPAMEMYHAINRLNAEKPVVVYMGTVAASGGYLVSLGARHIVANPATVTGSIGVKMEIPNVTGLMDKVGVSQTSLTSGPMKDAGSPFQPLTGEERTYLMGVVNDMFSQFRDLVRVKRRLTDKEVAIVSDGRIFTGRQALRNKLVDSTGDRSDALRVLAKLSGLPQTAPLTIGPPEEEEGILQKLVLSWLGLDPASSTRAPRLLFSF